MENRLKILASADLIDQEIFIGMQNVIEKLEKKWNLEIRNPQGEMLITHMANALSRVKKNEIIEPLDSDFINEIKTDPIYPKIIEVHHDLLTEFPFPVPENEQTYLISNLFSLFLAKNK